MCFHTYIGFTPRDDPAHHDRGLHKQASRDGHHQRASRDGRRRRGANRGGRHPSEQDLCRGARCVGRDGRRRGASRDGRRHGASRDGHHQCANRGDRRHVARDFFRGVRW